MSRVRIPVRSPLLLLLALLVFSLGSALAQAYPVRVGAVATDSALLNRAAIDRAAADLAALGVEALALYVEAPLGATLADAERYFDGALSRYGLAPDQSYVLVFVGTATLSADGVRPLFIEVGARLESRLGDPAFTDVLRAAIVTPRLLDGDPTGAFVAAFEAIGETLTPLEPRGDDLAVRPPSEPLPERRSPRLAWELALVAIVVLVGLLWYRSRGRRPAGGGADADELRRIKGELSQLLIDLSGGGDAGTVTLPPDPERQTDFVLIRDLLRSSQPERVAELERRYRQASAALEEVERGFEALRAEEAGGGAAAADPLGRYRALLAEAEKVRDFAAELAALWSELQSEAATVPERIGQLRRRVAALRAALVERFADGPAPDEVLGPASERLVRAQAAADSDPLGAVRILAEADAELGRLEEAVAELSEAVEGLVELGEDLAGWEEAGFDTASWRRERGAHERQLGLAAAELAAPGASVSEAVDAAQEFMSRVETQVALQRRNATRLEQLRLRGERVRELIEQGALAFDDVDDFAEPNWRDIRGNGTEAQKAAERAQQLYERAEGANVLARADGDADGAPARQDFTAAAADLDAAFAELDRAEGLVRAIVERLETLREARATGRRQLEAVESDLNAHRALLARPEVDREVGEEPARLLAEAGRIAAEAGSELAGEHPDWLGVLAGIQRADRLAAEALAGIRDQREAMQRRRLRLVSERDEATAARSRLDNFLRIHEPDMSAATRVAATAAADAFERATAVVGRSDVAEETELGRLLEEAARLFDEAQQLSDAAFAAAERDFSAAESARQEAAAAVAAAAADLDSLERLVRRGGIAGEMGSLLRRLQASLPQLVAGAGPERLTAIVGEAAGLRDEIGRAMEEAQELVRRRETALRRERQARLELERRRRAQEAARRGASWGASSSPAGPSWPTASSGSGRVRSVPSVGASRPAGKSIGGKAAAQPSRSGGGWGGAKRSKGGW